MNENVLTVLWWIGGIATAIIVLFLWIVLRKGRAMPGDHVFRASRLSRGHRLFPAQVVVTPASITLYQPQWIGKLEESIHLAHVSSVKINTHLIFADVCIETSGGRDPIVCTGHTKGDVIQIKQLVEKYQSAYYRQRQ